MIKTVSNINQIDVGADIRKDIDSSMSDKNLNKAASKVVKKMDEIKNRETRQGNSPAKGGQYKNTYSRQYASRQGKSLSPVTLRRKRKYVPGRAQGSAPTSRSKFTSVSTHHINRTFIQTGSSEGGLATLRFKDKEFGRIFMGHQKGAGHLPKRQIYPESDKQVPKELDIIAEREVFKILSGKVTR